MVCRGSVAVAGRIGLPFTSTVGLLVAFALALIAPGKNRKSPARACCVRTVAVDAAELTWRLPAYRPKKNVLFFRIGPHRRAAYWLRFKSWRGKPRKLFQNVLALKAVLRIPSTALPWNWFVPDRTIICTCPNARPDSASAGLLMTFT